MSGSLPWIPTVTGLLALAGAAANNGAMTQNIRTIEIFICDT
jgi:hypothetical protein